MNETIVPFIIDSLNQLSRTPKDRAAHYPVNPTAARFKWQSHAA